MVINDNQSLEVDWLMNGRHTKLPDPSKIPRRSRPSTPPPVPVAPQINDVNALRRTKSISAAECAASSTKKRGFFSKIFSKKESSTPPPIEVPRPRAMSVGGFQLERSRTESSSSDIDPKLGEFLRFYKAKGGDTLRLQPTETNRPLDPGSKNATTARRFDVKGRPIPEHPKSSPLPPAMKLVPGEEPKKSFLKRHMTASSSGAVSPTTEVSHPTEIPGLEHVKALKRVAFSSKVFFNDPPQQIPSRNPRKGEVEVLHDGSVVIHKLTAEERRKIMETATCGIVVGGSGHLKILQEHEGEALKDAARLSQKHLVGTAAAMAAAEARGNHLEKGDHVIDTGLGANVVVDKLGHEDAGCESESDGMDELESEPESDEEFEPVPVDTLYTRCCHLREILPIPAMVKQLKPGSTEPIPLLQLRNPKPSLVEVHTFGDFLSVAPVLCVSLDAVSLSVEMLRIILSALVWKTDFEKLSLRNTPLDEEGWRLVSWFVSRAKGLHGLDLTMVPDLPTNVQKPSKTASASTVKRMVCDLESRTEANWDLLTASLASRGGIEEVVLGGAQMSDIQFSNFIEMGCGSTRRLGLAYNQLTEAQVTNLALWIKNSHVTGLDAGFNDLRHKMKPFVDNFISSQEVDNNFRFVSLNSCNLDAEDNQALSLLGTLPYLKQLRYIDLSNNPGFFPDAMDSLVETLPLYPSLARIHLDRNNIDATSIVKLSEVLPLCKELRYVSLVGNTIDKVAAEALTAAMKQSRSIITLDIDYETIPDKYKQDISLCCVRNMEGVVPEESGEARTLQSELVKLMNMDRHAADFETAVQRCISRVHSVRTHIRSAIDKLFSLRLKGELSVEGKETLIRFCFIDASLEKGISLLSKRAKIEVDTLPSFDPRPQTVWTAKDHQVSGHTALLPFHAPSTHEQSNPADEMVALTRDDESIAQEKMRDQLREEGAMMKTTQKIVQGINSGNIDIESLANVSSKMNTEEIKEYLLRENDISTIAQTIEDMAGENIDNLYKKSDESVDGDIGAAYDKVLDQISKRHN